MAADAVAVEGKPGASDGDSAPPVHKRLVSVDTFRGLVMFLMLAEVLHLCGVAAVYPDNAVWRFLCYHQSHVEWRGCSLHDLIQPSFSFLVGTALAFSFRSRLRRGQSVGWLVFHAAWRAVVLVLLGVFLRSLRHDQTNWTFEDTLTQIGLGYLPLVLIGMTPRWATPGAIVIILLGYWTAFAVYPVPDASFDVTTVGVPEDWAHRETGFAAHWNKNTNIAADFDVWFLNLFPRESPFAYNRGGYLTLNFIPTLATMLLGLMAGRWLVDAGPAGRTAARFAIAAVILLALGMISDRMGIAPSVKRIWTSSWVLVSGGWCFAILGVLHLLTDRTRWNGWTFPLVVIGMNSITAYLLSWLAHDFIHQALVRHFGTESFHVLGPQFEQLVIGAAVLATMWLILFIMYRQKIFLKI